MASQVHYTHLKGLALNSALIITRYTGTTVENTAGLKRDQHMEVY